MYKYDVNNSNKMSASEKLINGDTNLIAEINKLKVDTDSIILAHYYQLPEVQDIADFVGDSLALAEFAVKVNNKRILLAGVYFMAETVKILAPDKVVLFPEPKAGCSLADSCKYDDLLSFLENNKDYKVVSYVNSSADVKSLSHVCCTSSNALKIVESVKEDKLIFVPDHNLGSYIKSQLSLESMVIWPGACHVHKKFSLVKLLEIKERYKDSVVIAHPECDQVILLHSDYVGSTSQLINYVNKSEKDTFIVATEPGVIHQMKKNNEEKYFIPVPPEDSECACNECEFMKMINLEKILLTLKTGKPEILISKEIGNKASIPIKRMMEISK